MAPKFALSAHSTVTARSPKLAAVVTQPYDKISPEMQARYYALSPHNLVRIIRGRSRPGLPGQRLHARGTRFRRWIQSACWSPNQPALYPYYQDYEVPGQGGPRKRRRGFIALLRLEDYSARVVHRHEETLSGPKADRLELLKVTRAHFGQIFMLYSDPAGEIEKLLAAHAPGSLALGDRRVRHPPLRVAGDRPPTLEAVRRRCTRSRW